MRAKVREFHSSDIDLKTYERFECLAQAVEAAKAPSWPQLATRLCRIGMREFEDYRP